MKFKSNTIFDGKVYLNSVVEGDTTKVLVLGGSQEVQHRTLGNIVFSDTSDFLDSFTFNSPGIFQQNIATVNSANKTLTLSLVNQTAGTVFAAPSSLNGTPTFRGLVANDIPSLGYVSTNNVNGGDVALVNSINLNTIGKTNILYVGATSTNKPVADSGFIETNVYDTLGCQLFFNPNANDDFYFRFKKGSWGSWYQVASREWVNTEKLDKPVTTSDTTNYPFVVGIKINGDSARLPALDLGKNIGNSNLTTTAVRTLTQAFTYTHATAGKIYYVTGLPNKNVDESFRKFRVQDANGQQAIVDKEALYDTIPYKAIDTSTTPPDLAQLTSHGVDRVDFPNLNRIYFLNGAKWTYVETIDVV